MKKLQKIIHTYYNLLIVEDLWQAHCQILSIIFQKEFICKYQHDEKKVKFAELNVNIVTAFLNTQILKMT